MDSLIKFLNLLSSLLKAISSLITLLTAIGVFVPGKYQEYGVQTSPIIIFGFSLVITILIFFILGRIKEKPPQMGGDNKTQVQIGGRGNKQDMR